MQHVPPRPPRRRHHQEHRTMFAYYLNLALRSFRRNKVLTALMVLAIALGIGASMTTLTVFHVLSGDPVPTRSGDLFYVQLDPAGLNGFPPVEEHADQAPRFAAEARLRGNRAAPQELMKGGNHTHSLTNQSIHTQR